MNRQFAQELDALLASMSAFAERWRSIVTEEQEPSRSRPVDRRRPRPGLPDGATLRREYEEGASVRELREKYGVPVHAALRYAGTTFRGPGRQRRRAPEQVPVSAPPAPPPERRAAPISAGPITRGVVFYLDTTKLNHAAANLQLPASPAPDGEVRPFVCVRVAPNGTSTWMPITSQRRPYRLELRADWLVERTGSLLQGSTRSWLNGSIYVGDNEAFIDAEIPGDRSTRNRFSAAAMDTITEYMRGQLRREAQERDDVLKTNRNLIHDRREAAGR